MIPPGVCAVALNWCAEEETAACLRSLQQSDYPSLRILLVDNGSPDDSGGRLHEAFPEIPYLQNGANLGYAGGNNRAIALALENGADHVLVLNNDTVVERETVSRLVQAVASTDRVGAVGPKILLYDAPDRVWFAGGDFSIARALGRHRLEGRFDANPNGGQIEEVSFLTGCCLLLPAPVIQEVGGFAEEYFAYLEDVDLSLRLRRAGYHLLYQPAARLLHRASLDHRSASAFQIFQRDRNRRRLVKRHYRPADRVRFALFFYPTRLVRAVQYLARGDLERAGAIWRGMTAR